MEWYYADGNQQKGPVDKDELVRMRSYGVISKDTLVWCESMSRWEPYSQAIGEDAAVTSGSAPPLPQRDERDMRFVDIPSRMVLSTVALCVSVPMFCLAQCPGIVPLIPAIIAMVYSTQVGSRRQNGDYEGAMNCSRNARNFGYISLLFALLIILVVAALGFMVIDEVQIHDKKSQVRADMRSMATAIETYYFDQNTYPEFLWQTTTPIAYSVDLPEDTFVDSPHVAYIQYKKSKVNVDGEEHECWLLWGVGPDGVASLDVNTLQERYNAAPVPLGFSDVTYDVSNGTKSSGDIFYFSD